MFKYSHLIDFHNGDIMPLLEDSEAFSYTIKALAKLFKEIKVDKVVAMESRGFILGGAVACILNTGFVAVRKKGKLKGEKVSTAEFQNYSGETISLEMQSSAIKAGERVLIIDDWFETGKQVRGAIELVEKLGGDVVGIGVVVDDTSEETKEFLNRFNYGYLVRDL